MPNAPSPLIEFAMGTQTPASSHSSSSGAASGLAEPAHTWLNLGSCGLALLPHGPELEFLWAIVLLRSLQKLFLSALLLQKSAQRQFLSTLLLQRWAQRLFLSALLLLLCRQMLSLCRLLEHVSAQLGHNSAFLGREWGVAGAGRDNRGAPRLLAISSLGWGEERLRGIGEVWRSGGVPRGWYRR